MARLAAKDEVVDMSFFKEEHSELGKVYIPAKGITVKDTVTFSALFMDRLIVTGVKVDV